MAIIIEWMEVVNKLFFLEQAIYNSFVAIHGMRPWGDRLVEADDNLLDPQGMDRWLYNPVLIHFYLVLYETSKSNILI